MKHLVAESFWDKRGGNAPKIKYVLLEDNEPYAQGEYDEGEFKPGDVVAAAVRDRLPNVRGYFCEIGDSRTAFLPCEKYKTGDFVLLQVKNGQRDTKGAEVSDVISFAGRFCAVEFVPAEENSENIGVKVLVSKKITEKAIVSEIKDVAISIFEKAKEAGLEKYSVNVILRTELGSCERPIDRFTSEFSYYTERFLKCNKAFSENYNDRKSGKLNNINFLEYLNKIYRTACFNEITVSDGNTVSAVMEANALFRENLRIIPESKNDYSLFTLINGAKKLPTLLGRVVHLKSGGEIVIEKTEAMTVIDVNVAKSRLSHQELNLEAADEIMRQLMLRNIGGIVICDFINVTEAQGEILVAKLRELSGNDYSKCEVLGLTRLGLVEICRKR